MQKKTNWFLGILALVIIIPQFFQIDRSNPAIAPEQDYLTISNAPENIATLIRQSCYDCHSNTTTYPAYTYIQPVGAWVKHHVEEGREHLNFSTWGSYEPGRAAHKLEECYEVIESGEMPMASYTWMHSSAKLSTEQRSALVSWFKADYQQSGQSGEAAKSQGGHEENGEREEHEEHRE